MWHGKKHQKSSLCPKESQPAPIGDCKGPPCISNCKCVKKEIKQIECREQKLEEKK